MQLILTRKYFNKQSTIGELSIDGKIVCFILEDTDRDFNQDGDHEDKELGEKKEYGNTAIPYGEYPILLEKKGTIYEAYKKRDWAKVGFPGFDKIFKGSLLLRNIQGYERVHIHIGNFIKDTLGCPLTGTRANTSTDPMSVSGSTTAYVKLYKEVIKAFDKGESVTIKIVKSEK